MDYGDKVKEAISASTINADGKAVFAEGTSEEIIFMAGQELRRRDTQSALSRSTQTADALTAENNLLAESLASQTSGATPEQLSKLEELKATDVEEWRKEVNKIEAANKTAAVTARDEIKTKAKNESEIERRARLLEEYNTANPKAMLTDDVITNDIPPRLTNQLADGTINFDQFMAKAAKYITTGKVMTKGTAAPEQEPDIGKMGGSHLPDGTAVDSEIVSTYKTELY
ncbi:MAG: hypothetical protein HRU18_06680 [Pseudoalteromonas sp.]|uniref:hypothetical protein n=1 Tax=Pseudoalteromonas sp. TaxID=53249 RepID=UPI001E0CB698|nr:hypothetical protein [Pseudoalteromonas sp.]NRA77875.1 hypothetical protein [Pseudoalteromonas sp.]